MGILRPEEEIMAHFFTDVSAVREDRICLTGEDLNHMKNVLRMKINEECTVSDGTGITYKCRIGAFNPGEAELLILSKEQNSHELKAKITLYQGLPKSDKLESIIQKSVELGAYRIVPVEMKRCIVRWDEKKGAARQKRYQAIAESAAKQSKRDIIPEVGQTLRLKEAIKEASENSDVILVPYENADGMDYTRNIIKSIGTEDRIAVFIGPEGGFETSEIEDLKDAGAKIITLGKRILRTETAGPAIIGILMFHLESGEY